MSSTPVALPPKPYVSKLDSYLKWFKAHEKILIISIGAVLAFHFYSSAIAAWDRHDSRQAEIAAAQVKADDAVTKDLKGQLVDLQAQVAQTNAELAKQIAQNNTNLKKQQDANNKATLAEVAARIQKLAALPPVDVNPLPIPGSLVVSDAGSRTIVNQLEEVPVLQAQVTALQTELKNDQTIIDKQTQVIAQLDKDLVDEKKSHVADVAAEKVKTKHAFIKGLKIGFIAGLFIGIFGAHAVGI